MTCTSAAVVACAWNLGQSNQLCPSRSSPTPAACRAAADPLSQQALEVQAQDLALEDALYALDKALNSGSVEADVYLRQASFAECRCMPLRLSWGGG